MLDRLIEFLKNNYPDSNIDNYLDAKYIHLKEQELKKIANAVKNNDLAIKEPANCKINLLLVHFGATIILLKKTTDGYVAELSWETDFIAIHSIRNKTKGFYFIKFNFDNKYRIKLLTTDKKLSTQVTNKKQEIDIINKIMPVLKAFVSAVN